MADEDGAPRDFEELRQRLAQRGEGLSPRLAQVARHVLNHPEEVALDTLVKLAERAGVPPATITRFAKELDFAGFAEFQAVFRERLLGPHRPFAERVAGADLDRPGDVFAGLVGAGVQSLLRIEDTLDRAALAGFVAALAEAEAVHVASARGAFGLGAYSVYGLASVGKRAHLMDNLGAMRREQAAAIGPRDVLWVMTFDDYTPESVEVARMARAAGRRVVAITDNDLSPVAGLASPVLFVNEARLGHFRSQVPAMVVCQSVILSLGRLLGAAQGDVEQNNQTDDT